MVKSYIRLKRHQLRRKMNNISDHPVEFCDSLQSALSSEIGGKIAQILFQEFSPKLKIISENKYISSKTINDILELLDDEFVERKLSSITPKLKGIITDKNAEFINSLMLDNKFSAEKIISELKSFLENYENVIDVESDTIFPLGENLFAYKNSQGFYEIVYKNIQSKTVHFKNHPNFLKVPSKHSNNIFSGCTETGCYIFQVVPENVFGEDGDFIRIKHHFFENAAHISELHFDEQMQENTFDIQSEKNPKKYKSTQQTHIGITINSNFEQKDLLNDKDDVTRIKLLNGVLIASDGEFPNPHSDYIEGVHSFYSLTGKKLLEMKGYFNGELESENIISIVNDDGKIFIEIKDGNINTLNQTPFYFSTQFANNIFQGGQVFLTTNGKVGTYNTETKTLEFFEIPKIKNIEKTPIRENVIMDISKQKYIFINGILYKLKDEFIIKNYEIHERTWKYLAGKELLSFEDGFAEDMNYSWSQEELDTYFDVVETINA